MKQEIFFYFLFSIFYFIYLFFNFILFLKLYIIVLVLPNIKMNRHKHKAMVFPVVMYTCESWTLKKTEHWRSEVFELWCWRRLLRVPWTARSNRSILKKINPEYSLEGLKVKLQYFGHLVWRADSLEKTPMLGKMAGEGRRGWQRMRWLGGITDWWTGAWASSGSWWRTEEPGVLKPMGLQRVGYDLAAEL